MRALADWSGGALLLGMFVLGWIAMGRMVLAAVAGASGSLPM